MSKRILSEKKIQEKIIKVDGTMTQAGMSLTVEIKKNFMTA